MYFLVMLCFTGCHEDDEISDITAVNWKVISIKMNHQTNFEFPKNDYILRFTSDSTYHLNVDVNACTESIFEKDNAGKINFKPMGCTKMCCDSDFAVHMLQLLYSIENYKVIGHILSLEGEGQIRLEKYN